MQWQAHMALMCAVLPCSVLSLVPASVVSHFPFMMDISLAPVKLKGKPSERTTISYFNLFDNGMFVR